MHNENLILSEVYPIVNQRLNEEEDVDKILNFIFETLLDKIPYDRMGVALIDDDYQTMKLRWVRSRMPTAYLVPGTILSLAGSETVKRLMDGLPRVISDLPFYYDSHLGSEPARLAVEEGIKSTLLYPIRICGRTSGFAFFSSKELDCYSLEHAEAYSSIAVQMGVILEYERLRQISDEKNSHDQTLNLVVHDLRSPISVIKACLDLFSRHPWFESIPSESKKVFGVLERNCASMMSLVDELADSRQLISISAKLCLTKTELRPFLEQVAKRCELLANQKEIFFTSYIDEKLPAHVDIDFERINQVIDNLVNNAIKFSGRNTAISLDTYLEEGKVCFSVSDHGPGIPEDEQGKLFREFSKTSVRPTEGEGSSGLGLFIVKRIVELHHGSVSVESKVGQGSVFKVTLPTTAGPLLH